MTPTQITKIMTPNGTELDVSPLTSVDIHEVDEWLKGQYLEQAAKVVKYLPPSEQNSFLQARMDAAMKLTCRFGDGRAHMFANVYGITRLTYQAVRSPKMTFEEYHTLLFPDDFLNDEGLNFVINFYKQIEGDDTPSSSTITDTFIANLTLILKDSEASSGEIKEKLAEATLQFYKTITSVQ